MQIDRTGSFKCCEIDRGITTTKNGFPQLTIRVQLLEWYDPQEQVWVDFSEFDMQMNAFLTLFGAGKEKDSFEPTLTYQQVMKVYGWDGRDFQVLAEMDAPELFQVRVDENTYEGAKLPYQIVWIDEADVDPNRSLKKLDTSELKALNSKFSAFLKKSGTAPAPATAKTKPVAPKTKVEPPKVVATPLEKESPKSKKIREANEQLAKEVKERDAKKKPPMPKKAVDQQQDDTESKTGYTKQQAWEFVCELTSDNTTDEKRSEVWHAAIEKIGGGIDEAELTPQHWFKVAHDVLDVIGKF